MSDDAPVLAPVAPGGLRTPLGIVVAASLLGVCAAVASGLAYMKASTETQEEVAPPPRRPRTDPRFGPGTKPRLEALRDHLVRGLLSLRLPDGTWESGDFGSKDIHRTETTALAIAGLSAAKWLGSKEPTLDDVIRSAKATLAKRQRPDGSFGSLEKAATRDRTYSALSSAILAFALAGDPADGALLDRAGAALREQWTLGPPTDFWTRALAAQAILALTGTGHRASLGDEPRGLLNREERGKPDWRDNHVAEAFVRVVRGEDPTGYPAQVVAIVVQDGADWGGDRSDLFAWLMRAWLCARVPGGDLWFEKALAGLEKAPEESGVILGDFYGDPVSRTACALLILIEGWTPQPPFGS